jgi:tRNA (cytidine/uridine-2'-O-)-methyltransferase
MTGIPPLEFQHRRAGIMRLALFQPDIPQNTGALMRLAACFRTPIDIIEPCGFAFDDKRLRRTAMDYGAACELTRHASWEKYTAALRAVPGARLVLLSTAAGTSHVAHRYMENDTLLVGRESHGVPDEVHRAADLRVRIPISDEVRSLNVAVAAAVVLGEALRQLGRFNHLKLL